MKKRVLALLLTLCMLVSLAPGAFAEDSEELLLDEEPLELIDFADEEPTEEPAEEPAEEPTEEPADEPDALRPSDGIEATSGVCGDNLTWTLDDAGTLTISGTGPMWDFDWDENLCPWNDGSHTIEAVVIENGVTSIGQLAFASHGTLTSVTIPDSVTYIGNGAFCNCRGLTSVTIPGRVMNIDDNAFYGCSGLTSVEIGNGVTRIGNCSFYGCSGLTSMTIPDSVTNIDNWAFYDCSSLTSVTIGNGVTAIGERAFQHCWCLTEITLPEGLRSIGVYAFADDSGLMSEHEYVLDIPASVTEIGRGAFGGCGLSSFRVSEKNPCFCAVDGVLMTKDGRELVEYPMARTGSSYTVPAGVTCIRGGAFYAGAIFGETYKLELETILLPDSLKEIGPYAFECCYTLKEVNLPGALNILEEAAFYNCIGLTEITIPGSVTSIGDWAFSNCSSMTSVTIGNGVNSIGKCAFSSCSSLTSVTIPDSVTNIGDWAFSNCSSMTSVTIGNGVKSIGKYAFQSCSSLTEIRFLGSAPTIGEGCFNGITTTAYYPVDDDSWTADVRQNYSGTITWVPYQSQLPAPVLTEAFNSATGVRVSWKPVDGAVKYELLRKNLTLNETQWKVVGETTECSLIDKTAKSSNRYTYTVRAVNILGNAGAYNETGRTCTYIAKADITDITVMADGVHLTWSKPAGAKNFRVMRRPDGVAKWTVLDVIQGTSYVDTTAKTGTKYWYTVRGVSMDNKVLINSYNGTGWSMKPLAAPVLTEAFNSATGVRVSWNAVDGASKYRLLRKNLTKNETEWSMVAETTECSIIDTSAQSASRYSYTVVCIDGNGRICSPEGNTRTCTYIAMAKITEIKGVSNGVSLTWSRPAGAKNFRVFRKLDGETKWTAIADVQGTSYLDTTAEKGVKYWYTVRAITMDGTMYTNSYNSYGWSVTRK